MRDKEKGFVPPDKDQAFLGAQEQYAKAVDVAGWLGFPLDTILAWCQGWFYWGRCVFSWTPVGWEYREPPTSWDSSLGRGFRFNFSNYDEAKLHGMAFGKFVDREGGIGPWEDTPEYAELQAQREAEEWARLDRLTTPTPLHLLSKSERKAAWKRAIPK